MGTEFTLPNYLKLAIASLLIGKYHRHLGHSLRHLYFRSQSQRYVVPDREGAVLPDVAEPALLGQRHLPQPAQGGRQVGCPKGARPSRRRRKSEGEGKLMVSKHLREQLTYSLRG